MRTSGNAFMWIDGSRQIIPQTNQLFYFDSRSGTNKILGGTIYGSSPNVGVWMMMYDGAINVQWFGAGYLLMQVGIPFEEVDDTPSFQAAINTNFAALVYVPTIYPGYRIRELVLGNDNVTNPVPIRIYGDNDGRTRIKPSLKKEDGSRAKGPMMYLKSHFIYIQYLLLEGEIEAIGTYPPPVSNIELGYYDQGQTLDSFNYQSDSTCIELQGGPLKIEDCWFSNFNIAINNDYNNPHNIIKASDDNEIRACRFLHCKYGIKSTIQFRNARIHGLCVFSSCMTAIRIDNTPGPDTTTEGVMINNCMIHNCGKNTNPGSNPIPAMYSSASYTYIVDSMVDLNYEPALIMENSAFSKLLGTWFASPNSLKGTSSVILKGVCTNFLIDNCNFNDSHEFNLNIEGTEWNQNPCSIVIQNSSFYTFDKIQDRIGDLRVENAVVSAVNCIFNTNTDSCIFVTDPNEKVVTSLHLTSCRIIRTINGYTNPSVGIVKARRNIDVQLFNCPTHPTEMIGYVRIDDPTNFAEIDNNLCILNGQAVSILATNASSFDYVTAGVSGPNLRFIRSSVNEDIVVNYIARVFNNF